MLTLLRYQFILLTLISLVILICIPKAHSENQKSSLPAPEKSLANQTRQAIKVEISILGIEGQLKKNALAYLELRQNINKAHFSEMWLKNLHKKAEKNIQQALQPFGYYQADVLSRLTKTNDNTWLAQYTVTPGKPVKIKAIDIIIDGPGKNDPEVLALVKHFPIKPADILQHERYETEKEQLVSNIEQLGYAQIKLQKAKIIVDPLKASAQIQIHLLSGDKYYIGELNFLQDFLNNDFILTYTRDVKQGAPFSQEDLLALSDTLYSSGYFSSVTINPDFSKAKKQQVPIDITLKPANRHKFTLGAGYDTEIEANASFRWQQRYLNKRGHYSDFIARFSAKKSTISGAYWIPTGDPRTDKIGIIPKIESENTDNTDRDTFDLETGYWFTWQHWENTLFTEYKYERFSSGLNPKNTTKLFSFGTRNERRNFEKALFPRRGWSLYSELRFANSSVLSDIDYFRLHLQSRLLFPIGDRGRLILRGELGLAQASDFDLYPSSLRFYAGGDQSVRGYKWKALGPKDKDGEVIGGRNVFSSSIEYNHQIYEQWVLAGFVDAGNAYNSKLDKIYYGSGFGLRWIAPFGLLRADLGFPLTSDDDSKKDTFVFYFGFEISL